MIKTQTVEELLEKISQLENRLEESEQLIQAIKDGEVDAFAVNENDRSEIYTLQSGDYAYRLLIEEIGEGAVNITEEGLVVYTNKYFCELLKLPYEEVIGRPLTEFINDESRVKFETLLREARDGRSNGELNLYAEGEIIPVYVSMTSLQPKLATVGIIVTDRTGIKKHEADILQYQRELEQKNSELAQNNDELTSFTYIASHDLQEPLRKIQTFSKLILDSPDPKLSAGTTVYFQRIVSASQRMQSLILSLLSYSRTNIANAYFERVDLNEILADVIGSAQELIDENQVILQVDQLPEISGIPQQLNQLFSNLILNSIKYKNPKLSPIIRIESVIVLPENLPEPLSSLHDYFLLRFSDNGIGFEPQYADKIFELFQRLHSRMEYEGTGIGLSICKKIVQNHKGMIRAFGTPGSGASFEIYFPRNLDL